MGNGQMLGDLVSM